MLTRSFSAIMPALTEHFAVVGGDANNTIMADGPDVFVVYATGNKVFDYAVLQWEVFCPNCSCCSAKKFSIMQRAFTTPRPRLCIYGSSSVIRPEKTASLLSSKSDMTHR